MRDMAEAYKSVVQSIGLAPVVHDESFVGMTQNPLSTTIPEQDDLYLHYKVSKTWQRVLENDHDSSFANDVLRQQQAAVVAVDQRVLKNVGDDANDSEDEAIEDTNEEQSKDLKKWKQDVETKEDSVNSVDETYPAPVDVAQQNNEFVDAKSQDDASTASDETTLDQDENEQTIQDISTLLVNQNLVLGTPAQQKEASDAADETCPRNNKTLVVSGQANHDGLNALVRHDTKTSPPKEESQYESQYESIAAQNSESVAFFTADEADGEDTQEEDDDDNDGSLGEANGERTQQGKRCPESKPLVPSANVVARASATAEESPMASGEFMPETVLARTEEEGRVPCSELPVTEASTMEEERMPDTNPTEAEETPTLDAAFAIGTIVHVEDRCWPGVNKQGGVARITKVHRDGGAILYDVAYVLGGKETRVEAVFLSLQEDQQKRRSPSCKDELSPDLLVSLAADGFDTEGKVQLEHVKRVEVKAATKRKVLDANKSNEPATGGRKKRQKKDEVAASASMKKNRRGAKPSLPALNDKQKREVADAHYEERFRLAESQSVISVVASSLAEHDMTMLQLLCKETRSHDGQFYKVRFAISALFCVSNILASFFFTVKVRMTDTFNPSKTTFVVMAVDPQSVPENLTSRSRTLKVMRAVLAGVPIVCASWISSCLNKGRAVMPTRDMYIRTVPAKTTDPLINAKLGASLYASRLHQAKAKGIEHSLLGNVRVLLCGQYNTADGSPRKADIQTLVRESGATMLTSVGSAMNKLKKIGDADDSKVMLLCDECQHDARCGISTSLTNAVTAALERDDRGVLVVNSTWLFDSISCGEMAPVKPFMPRNPRAYDLWKLCHQ